MIIPMKTGKNTYNPIISHHSDTYPIPTFNYGQGSPAAPAFLPGGALPCLHTTPKAQDVLHGPNARQDLAPVNHRGCRDPRHTVGWDTNGPRWPIGNQWHEVKNTMTFFQKPW